MPKTERQSRYLATLVGNITLLFPTEWVREIIRIDRDLVLDLPFYDRRFKGVINHHGRVLPLFDARYPIEREIIDFPHDLDRYTVVCLNDRAGNLAGMGAIVDRAVSSQAKSELPAALFERGSYESLYLISAESIGDRDWQPQSQLTVNNN